MKKDLNCIWRKGKKKKLSLYDTGNIGFAHSSKTSYICSTVKSEIISFALWSRFNLNCNLIDPTKIYSSENLDILIPL